MRAVDDDGFFGIPTVVLGVAAIILIAAIAIFVPRKGLRMPDPPSILGCYSAPGGPDIQVEQERIRFHQVRAFSVPYKLEYHKGWALALEARLAFVVADDGSPGIAAKPGGQFLFVSRELEVATKVPSFDILDSVRALSYHRIGASCER